MICQEILTAPSNDPREELDTILAKCCELVLDNQEKDPDYYGMVGACVVGPEGQLVYRTSYKNGDKYVHAEVAALEAYKDADSQCIVVTTLSPCNRPMSDRAGASCEDVINSYGIEHVYCGYKDPTQDQDDSIETHNTKLKELCKKLADTFLKENFHDGKRKGKSRPGRVKRAGASCKGSVSSLRAKAHKYGGEKGKMYHWCANMKGGKNESVLDEKWSQKYKRSINCAHPRGFSQRAHCQGRKKK